MASEFGIIERIDAFNQPLYWTGKWELVDGKKWTTIPSEAVHIAKTSIPQTLLKLADQGYRDCKAVWLQEV